MIIDIYDQDGSLGTIRVVDDAVVADPPSLANMVVMPKDTTAAEAVAGLDGWSNGWLSGKAVDW